MDKEARQSILEQLSALAGEQFQEDQIERRGTKLVLPERMSPTAAIKTLQQYVESQEQEVTLQHRTRYRPLDGLVAIKRVLRKMTGMTPAQMTVQTFFGPYTPPTINVQTGVDEYEACPTGEFPVEIFSGTVGVDVWSDDEFGVLFGLNVTAPRKYEAAVKGFFVMVDEELKTNSIYRGKAITAEEEPTFMDLRGVDPSTVVYSQEVVTQLDANIWSLIEHTNSMRENNLPLKRAVLLEGPYGTGKTLAAYLTAQRAEDNDWTFIFVRPGKDSLTEAMATAQLYQPAVVFFEDIDVSQNEGTNVTKLLDVFDGIQAKGTEIVAVLTTNHPEKIHKGLVRPGRLDAVIHIGELDAQGIGKLIRANVDEQWLPDTIDEEAIAEAMEGFMPAFVKEAIDRAVRYTIARNDGHPGPLSNQDFIDAGIGLRPQLDLMNDAKEEWKTEPVDAALSGVVERVLGNWEFRNESGSRFPLHRKEESSRAN